MNPRFLIAIAALVSAPLYAADNKAWTDPAKAAAEDPDFVIQGEYSGKLGEGKVGVQVVALGGAKFDVVLYPGGLPGDGFSGDRKTRQKGTASTKDGATTVEVGGKKGAIAGGKFTLDGNALERVERKSATAGTKPPAGATVLFDGKNADKWNGGKLDGDTLMQGVTSKDKYQDVTVHVEFKIPFQPDARGQGRGNSGCYLQGRYEVQMLDSFGLEGENNECGGIYTIKAPDVNMAYPPLAWQTYDIDYTAAKFENGKRTSAAKITVKHNGVLIHKDVDLSHGTTAAPEKEGAESGPIFLQDHGNPVRYRNIWVVEKK